MLDFLNTRTVRKFFDVELPGMRRSLERLATALEDLVKTQQPKTYGVPQDLSNLVPKLVTEDGMMSPTVMDNARKLDFMNSRLGLEMDDTFEHFKEAFINYVNDLRNEGKA